jgi:Polyketide cyclase / dehydrase and lipid transport
MSMDADLANRSHDIHWPRGFTPTDADLFAHSEIYIDACCQRVWRHIVEAARWPEWYPNSKDVQVNGGVLRENCTFTWTTFGLALESKINEFAPYGRIGWYGYAPGFAPSFYHTWYLAPRGDGCRVVTDGVGKGPGAFHLRENAMHKGHELWLIALKNISEKIVLGMSRNMGPRPCRWPRPRNVTMPARFTARRLASHSATPTICGPGRHSLGSGLYRRRCALGARRPQLI